MTKIYHNPFVCKYFKHYLLVMIQIASFFLIFIPEIIFEKP